MVLVSWREAFSNLAICGTGSSVSMVGVVRSLFADLRVPCVPLRTVPACSFRVLHTLMRLSCTTANQANLNAAATTIATPAAQVANRCNEAKVTGETTLLLVDSGFLVVLDLGISSPHKANSVVKNSRACGTQHSVPTYPVQRRAALGACWQSMYRNGGRTDP